MKHIPLGSSGSPFGCRARIRRRPACVLSSNSVAKGGVDGGRDAASMLPLCAVHTMDDSDTAPDSTGCSDGFDATKAMYESLAVISSTPSAPR